MATDEKLSDNRVPSLSSIGSDFTMTDNDSGHPGLRPLPTARVSSPTQHYRQPGAEVQTFSHQIPQSSSRNTSPRAQTRSLGSGLPASSSASTLHSPNHTRAISLTASPEAYPSAPFGHRAHGGGPLATQRIGEFVPDRSYSPTHSRPSSRDGSGSGSRPSSPALDLLRPATPTEGKLVKKKGWLPTKLRGRSGSKTDNTHEPTTWAIAPQGRSPYDLAFLIKSQVPELWDDRGDIFVHIYPRDSTQGPSFRIHSSLITSSLTLRSVAERSLQSEHRRYRNGQNLDKHMRNLSLGIPSTPTVTPPPTGRRSSFTSPNSEYHLDDRYRDSRFIGDMTEELLAEYHIYLSLNIDPTNASSRLSSEDIEKIVAIRNLFAFLVKEALVATPGQPTLFAILSNVAKMLEHYDFSNQDRSSFGEVPAVSFKHYIDKFDLADVRASREKTLQAIVLGERMKSWELYNEGFVHGVGKWDDIMQLHSPLLDQISDITRKRMERAFSDLENRRRSMESRLQDFDFPSLFAGVAASSVENKSIDFKAWKASFMSMRKHTLALYKNRYGSWPPKAKSKKNNFEESGLNRVLLMEVYQDFSDLYDILVDRKELTMRTADFFSNDGSSIPDPTGPIPHALRRLLSEFDRSTPPVQPPVPFDIPMMPDLTTTRRGFESLPARKQAKERGKKLRDNEINQALLQSSNRDSIKATPFIESFLAFERQSAHGKSIEDINDLRIGQWIFMYVVLQSLPLVVVDAPGLRYTEGVEYFLCEVPKGAVPWNIEDSGLRKAWYGVTGGSGLVSLPADVVDHGVEGIYHRSHCWQVAERWISGGEHGGYLPQASNTSGGSLLFPPPVDADAVPGSRSSSPDRASSVRLGLEALPLPAGVTPYNGSQTNIIFDPTKSFEAILGPASSPKARSRSPRGLSPRRKNK